MFVFNIIYRDNGGHDCYYEISPSFSHIFPLFSALIISHLIAKYSISYVNRAKIFIIDESCNMSWVPFISLQLLFETYFSL